jgi:hypothetical protein
MYVESEGWWWLANKRENLCKCNVLASLGYNARPKPGSEVGCRMWLSSSKMAIHNIQNSDGRYKS